MDVKIVVNMDKKCAECGKGGAATSGICLRCFSKAVGATQPLKSARGREIQAAMQAQLRHERKET